GRDVVEDLGADLELVHVVELHLEPGKVGAFLVRIHVDESREEAATQIPAVASEERRIAEPLLEARVVLEAHVGEVAVPAALHPEVLLHESSTAASVQHVDDARYAAGVLGDGVTTTDEEVTIGQS